MLKMSAATIAGALEPAALAERHSSETSASSVEQWGLFEVSLKGPSSGNPFQEVTLKADFSREHRAVQVKGFYDGDGTYRIRFMPDMQGEWTYRTTSSAPALDGQTGRLTCTPPTAENYGPVTTAHRYHFVHADGTPYFPFGTTTYAFLFTDEENAANSLTE